MINESPTDETVFNHTTSKKPAISYLGKITLPNGHFYQGELMEGIPHGLGEERDSTTNALIYKGRFYEGKRQGDGILYDSKTHLPIYKGRWLQDKRMGYGKYYRPDGTLYYNGLSIGNLPSSAGRFYYPDGKTVQYKGNLYMGRPDGEGEQYRPDGSLEYKGDFLKGKPHGQGTYYNVYLIDSEPYSYAEFQGEWEEGQFKKGTQFNPDGTERKRGIWDNEEGQIIYRGFVHPDPSQRDNDVTVEVKSKLIRPVAIRIKKGGAFMLTAAPSNV